MSRFLNSKYEKLTPYTPGEQLQREGLIKLNTNESPFPPSPRVMEVINSAETGKLNLYPDPEAGLLTKAASKVYNIDENMIIAGNGSDELLAFSFMIFQNRNKKIYFPDISYGFYKVYAEVYGAKIRYIALGKKLKLNPDDYCNLDGMIVIANPNAQTGAAITRADIEKILSTNKNNLVLIDEAYVNFGAESSLQLIDKYDNLLVIQTFSKDRNLAGARVGLAFANEEIIADLKKIKYSFNPYNLNRLSILAGAAALEDEEYYVSCREKIKKTRERFAKEMAYFGFDIIPSLANFVLAEHYKVPGADYHMALKQRNILVRHFDEARIRDHVRITIGSEEEMAVVIEATENILN
jgi:histidinol-phosphate aminotransferase